MVSVGTQTPWSWLHSFTEDERKKSENAVPDRPLPSASRSSGLPEIVACSREEREEQKEGQEKLSLPHIVAEEAISVPESQHLAALQFTSDSYSSSSTSSGEEEVGDAILPPLAVEPSAPDTELAVGQLSWPAVLRYLRESESEASKYFSIDREPRKEVERDRETARENTSNELMANEARCATEEAVVDELNNLCHFCGQPLGEWSVLKSATGSGDQGRAEACCWQFKEFCLLVAGCLRQMIAERVSAQPTEITLKLRSKKDVKMEAEERALALLRRRKRQRERMAKKTLQSSSFYSLTKQTKTIQFSLLSPAVLSTGWTSGERQRTSVREQKKKKKRNVTRKLPPEILELLIKSMPGRREVDVRQYPGSSISFCTLLPDHTGHYRYLSGSLAVLIYSHTPGVLSYLLFSERGEEVLGYADQLGRIWCSHPPPDSHLLRLWLTSDGEGAVFSGTGEVVRRWGREREAEQTVFQPLVSPLNKHLHVQLARQAEAVISFSPSQHHHVKFTVTHKLKEKSEILVRERTPDVTESYYHCYLLQAQARLKYLLPVQGTRRGGQRVPRARSRSTGTLTFTSNFSHSSRII